MVVEVMMMVMVIMLLCRTGRFVITCPSRRIKLMVGCYRSVCSLWLMQKRMGLFILPSQVIFFTL